MISARWIALAMAQDDGALTWRVTPATPRVGDQIVLEGLLEPTPRADVSVEDAGAAPGLVESSGFEFRRDGTRLILTRSYVAAASGEVELPRTIVCSGAARWSAKPARLDVDPVDPGRAGRELVDPLQPIALHAPSSWRVPAAGLAFVVVIGWLLWRGSVAAKRNRQRALRLEPPAPSAQTFTERLDAIAAAFAVRAVSLRATADALRDLLRDVLAVRVGEPARARTSAELDALVEAAGSDAEFCRAIFAAVEEQCYGNRAAGDEDDVSRWLDATRRWLTTPRGAA